MKIKCLVDGWDEQTFTLDQAIEHVITRSANNTGELEQLRAKVDKTTELVVQIYKLLPAATIVALLNACHDQPLHLEPAE